MNTTDPLLWCFVALAFVALLALLASRWPGWLKALLLAGITALYFGTDIALDGMWGRPSPQALPERFVLLSVVIEEPGKSTAGALYLWVHALDQGKPAREPRAYRLPYDKSLHTVLDDSMKKLQLGVAQMGSASPKRAVQALGWLRQGSDEQIVTTRDLPLAQLPEK
jgi:hypothetical protein